MDYGALPPEINSARMYSGPGSGSMMAAAAAWDQLATELYAAATAYGGVTSSLTGAWMGPAAMSMAQAAAPYITWLCATAGQLEQTAAQAGAAAAAYEAAWSATVPPPVIAANRAQLMLLVATNVLGQNSPAIAATETEYDQMWAQDAAVMYGYAAASAAAATLTPFSQPSATTDAAGSTRQGAAVTQATEATAGAHAQEVLANGSQFVSTVPQALQGLASAPVSKSSDTSLSSLMSKFNTLTGPAKFSTYPMTFLNQALSASKAVTAPVAAVKAGATGLASGVDTGARALGAAGLPGLGTGGASLSAGLGRGVSIGALSAPHAWLTAPTTSAVTAGPPSAGWTAAPPSGSVGAGPTGLPLMPLANMARRGVGGPAASRFELRASVVPRSPAAG
jgi:PPE-repeat protein